MISQKAILPLFILLAIAQLYVPLQMILSKEEVISADKNYKFKTAPVDPSDPLRGKYIALRFDEDSIPVLYESNWDIGEMVYCLLYIDESGYAKINSVSKEEPAAHLDYLRAPVHFVSNNGDNFLRIRLPFDRYYMEESKAYEAEQIYRASLNDSSKVTYALVAIKEGEAVLKDVLINDRSIKDLVMSNR